MWKNTIDKPEPAILVMQDNISYLDFFLAELYRTQEVSIDIETSGLELKESDLVGISMASGNSACYIPIGHRLLFNDSLVPGQIPVSTVKEYLTTIIDIPNLLFIYHYGIFDTMFINQKVLKDSYMPIHWDTCLFSKYYELNKGNSLPRCLSREKIASVNALKDMDWKNMPKGKAFTYVPIQFSQYYAGADAVDTLNLYHKQLQKVDSKIFPTSNFFLNIFKDFSGMTMQEIYNTVHKEN